MKWALCTSTALCTAFLLQCDEAGASQFEFSISGYLATLVSAGKLNTTASRDDPSIDPDYGASGVFEYGEFWIMARQKLGKDYAFGGQLEFDTFPLVEPDFNTSEHYVFVDTPYGLFNVGARYSAAYQMQYAAPILSLPINSGWVTAFIPPNPDSTVVYRTPAVSTYLDYGSKENNFTYYTPRLGGFQLGISYAPAIAFTGDGQNFPVEAERNTQYYNGLSVGVNYVDTIDDFDVALAVGYRRTDASAEILDAGGSDYQAASFGASFSRWGVTVGGSYANAFDGQVTLSDGEIINSTEGVSWDVGIAYTEGPWTIGTAYMQTEVEGAPPGTPGFVGSSNDDKLKTAIAGIDYNLAPGIDAIGGVMFARWSAESGAVNSGVIVATGFSFDF